MRAEDPSPSPTRHAPQVCLSTINRTPRSYAVAVVGAERVAGLLPVGTHDWEQFLTPGAGTAWA